MDTDAGGFRVNGKKLRRLPSGGLCPLCDVIMKGSLPLWGLRSHWRGHVFEERMCSGALQEETDGTLQRV